jgi:predicted ATPase/transcriptional regulator with XRE-family HTH domain
MTTMHDAASFGRWLKQRRQGSGLTQDVLAEQVGCATHTIRKIEGGKRRPSYQMAERLAQALELAPEERKAFIHAARNIVEASPVGSATPSPAPAIAVRPLPMYPTPFMGREQELAELAQLLAKPVCRLITLVGPGGVGKTRLALEVVARCPDFADGVAFVPLASMRNADELVRALADVLGVVLYGHTDPVEQLLNYLRAKQLLLVLDNLEHLLDSIEVLTALLMQAPHITLLVTSRERLNLQSEWVVELAGLPVPDDDIQEGLPKSAAVALFVERARRVQGNFTLTMDNARAVTQICRAVEGLPLGIELAATWVRLLSCEEIAAELGRNLAFLHTSMRDVPARHRSMQAVVEHSWTLLGEQEQQVLRKLAAFRGGFEREAAEQVAGATLPILAALVDKSLLRREPNGRYQVHELLRQYAEEQLETAGEADGLRTAHSAYYLDFLHHREADLKGRRQLAALHEIESDFENIRMAWNWALQQRNESAIDRALESLTLFFPVFNRYLEGVELLRLARESLAPPRHEPTLLWARVLARLAFLQMISLPSSDDIASDLQTSLAIAEKHGDRAEIAFSLLRFGSYHTIVTYDYATALTYLEESFDYYQSLDDRYHSTVVLLWLGICHSNATNLDIAYAYLRQALELARESGNLYSASLILACLSKTAISSGEYAVAEDYCQEALALGIVYSGPQARKMSRQSVRAARSRAGSFGFPIMMAWLLPVAAVICGHEGQKERAVEVLALASMHPLSAISWLEQWPLLAALRAELEAELGAEAYTAAWERGKGLDVESVAAALVSAI